MYVKREEVFNDKQKDFILEQIKLSMFDLYKAEKFIQNGESKKRDSYNYERGRFDVLFNIYYFVENGADMIQVYKFKQNILRKLSNYDDENNVVNYIEELATKIKNKKLISHKSLLDPPDNWAEV